MPFPWLPYANVFVQKTELDQDAEVHNSFYSPQENKMAEAKYHQWITALPTSWWKDVTRPSVIFWHAQEIQKNPVRQELFISTAISMDLSLVDITIR